MKRVFCNLFTCSAFLFSITACKQEIDTVNIDMGYNYFPDDSGVYVIYKVDSMIFDDFTNTKRTSTKYLKEIVTDQFIDNLGRTAKRIERSYSDTITHTWQLYNVFYVVKTNKVLERWEN